MIGSTERKCIRSKWSGQKPICFGLNQENDYASNKTIDYKSQVFL